MDNNEKKIHDTLKDIGCEVEIIPESEQEGEKRPDFFVKLEGDNYIIELKTKGLDDEVSEYRWTELKTKKVVSNVIPLNRENKYSNRIKDSVKQLEAYDHDGFKLAWFNNIDIDAYDQAEKFRYALYGIGVLADFVKKDGLCRECYFLNQSDFYRHRDTLDAAFVSVDDGTQIITQLFVNPLSVNYVQFKQSSLYKLIDSMDALIDPLILENNGDIFYAHEDDGKTLQEVIESMIVKYECENLIIMPMQSITARTGVMYK